MVMNSILQKSTGAVDEKLIINELGPNMQERCRVDAPFAVDLLLLTDVDMPDW